MRLHKKLAIVAFVLLGLVTYSLIAKASPQKAEELAPPRITSPIYEGAEVVEVWGFTPKANVRVFADGTDIGGGSCLFSKCTFNVKKLSANQKITAKQTVGGITSYPTRDEDVVTVQKIPSQYLDPKYKNERLLPPEVDSPLFECQAIVPVKEVIQGAFVQVFSLPDLNDPIGRIKTPWNYARPRTTQLTKDQKIVANQTLLFSNPSDNSSPEELVKAKPTTLPAPDINEADLVVGSDAIAVYNLWIGAKVDIYYEEPGKARESIGGSLAPWPGTIFSVKPLESAWVGCSGCIKAEQSLCDVKATSKGYSVKNSLDSPEIKEPVCAGSSEVTVCKTSSNPILSLFLKGSPDTLLSQQGSTGGCTSVTLGDKSLLNNLDQIYVTQAIGNLESKSSTITVTQTSHPTFEIGNGKFCKPCSGQDNGPIFVRDALTKESGPVFKATMCGAEAASVEIRDPKGTLLETIILDESKTQKGYFEGIWDWDKIGWKTSKDLPVGEYTAKFKIDGTQEDKYFYVFTQGCVELEVLCAHNKVRAQVHNENTSIPAIAPLTWSDTLADHAQKWADYLFNTHQEKHDDSILGIEGENIAYGVSSYTDAVDLWADEKKCFQNGVFDDIYNHNSSQCDAYQYNPNEGCTKEKNWKCAGHYSQIVWRNHKEVGCGKAGTIVVCRYSPPGNVYGEKTY